MWKNTYQGLYIFRRQSRQGQAKHLPLSQVSIGIANTADVAKEEKDLRTRLQPIA